MSDDASAGAAQSSTAKADDPTTRTKTEENGSAVESSKFDLGAPPPSFEAGELPWGYGDDRITALVRSPESIYVYWEITDDAIARARRGLGAGGEWAWLNLRVYDTTGRDFDGINANDYFDVRIERSDREWFFQLDRAAGSFHVEVGLKSHEGFFVATARSGRADLPRRGPSPNHALEWMTVTTDQAHPAARPYESKYKGPVGSWSPPPGPAPGGPPPPRAAIVGGGAQHETRTWTWAHPAHVEVRWEGPWIEGAWRNEWRARWLDARGGKSVFPVERALWSLGPFPLHVADPGRFEIRLLGDGPVMLEESSSGLEILGPWQIVIRGASTEATPRVLSTWRVHWVRVEPAQVERWWTSFERVRSGAWARATLKEGPGGASESRIVLEGGASELWRMGASERLSIGGSEWLAMGASWTAGASERALGGASAFLFGGASERASASQWLGFGASERSYGSEHLGGSPYLGASERWSDVIFSGGSK